MGVFFDFWCPGEKQVEVYVNQNEPWPDGGAFAKKTPLQKGKRLIRSDFHPERKRRPDQDPMLQWETVGEWTYDWEGPFYVTAAGEDLGYVPLEAFLSGKAVLTTEDAGGPLEFVKDGETGIVTAPRPEALGVALRLAWSRPEALRAMGEAGRARAARLDWDGPVRALLAAAGL